MSLLLRPRGAASLWRWRRLSEGEEFERVERRLDAKLDDDAPIGAAAALAHLFGRGTCLLAAPSKPELIAGREAEATGCLEAQRGAAEAEAPAAAAVIEQRHHRWLKKKEVSLPFCSFLQALLRLSPPSIGKELVVLLRLEIEREAKRRVEQSEYFPRRTKRTRERVSFFLFASQLSIVTFEKKIEREKQAKHSMAQQLLLLRSAVAAAGRRRALEILLAQATRAGGSSDSVAASLAFGSNSRCSIAPPASIASSSFDSRRSFTSSSSRSSAAAAAAGTSGGDGEDGKDKGKEKREERDEEKEKRLISIGRRRLRRRRPCFFTLLFPHLPRSLSLFILSNQRRNCSSSSSSSGRSTVNFSISISIGGGGVDPGHDGVEVVDREPPLGARRRRRRGGGGGEAEGQGRR